MPSSTFASLDPLFRPRSVAVAGVSSRVDPSGSGGGLGFLRAIREMGFPTLHECRHGCTSGDCATGCLYPVNPKADEIDGLRCYPSLTAIPGDVDYVISSVPAVAVPGLLEEAAAKQVRAVHLFTAGFSETGEEDRADLERQILERARAAGIRLIGPNCMGLYVPAAGLSFMAGFPTEPGTVGMLSQSGANAGELVRFAGARGVRFSKVISYGNAADLNESELLEYLGDDPETEVVLAYIEGVRDGRRFAAALRRAAARKPVVILKGGRTEAGSRAARSHTGSLAGSIEVFDALCRQAGALRVASMDELVDLAVGFRFVPPPRGAGVAVVGAGGGVSVLAADAFAAEGLELPPMPEDVQAAFRAFVPIAGTSVRNPIDTTSVFRPEEFVRTIELAARPASIAALVYHTSFSWGSRSAGDQDQRAADLARNLATARNRIGKPLLISVHPSLSGEGLVTTGQFVERCVAEGFAIFDGIDGAARALAGVRRWQQTRVDRGLA
jgi:acyl-CoA synthetase (NDP forming)